MQAQIKEELQSILYKFHNHLIIVEGKKDKISLEKLGFFNIFILNEHGKSLNERIEEIESIAKKKKVCILTDFDKKGKQLYLKIKSALSERPIHLDCKLRSLLLKTKITHIEGLAKFLED